MTFALFDLPTVETPAAKLCASCGIAPTTSSRTTTCASCEARGFRALSLLEQIEEAPADPLALEYADWHAWCRTHHTGPYYWLGLPASPLEANDPPADHTHAEGLEWSGHIGAGLCAYGLNSDDGPRCSSPATHLAWWYKPATAADPDRNTTGGMACCLEHANYYANAWTPTYPGETGHAALTPLAYTNTATGAVIGTGNSVAWPSSDAADAIERDGVHVHHVGPVTVTTRRRPGAALYNFGHLDNATECSWGYCRQAPEFIVTMRLHTAEGETLEATAERRTVCRDCLALMLEARGIGELFNVHTGDHFAIAQA